MNEKQIGCLDSRILHDFLICPACGASRWETMVFDGSLEAMSDAVASCASCGSWYRVEDGILELLPEKLKDRARCEAFISRHRDQWDRWDHVAPHDEELGNAHKLGQKSFYDEDAVSYESSMIQLPFWRALDHTFQEEILSVSTGRDVLLEVGCGTGRVSIPCHESFGTVLGFDISEAMVRTAASKSRALSIRNVHYFIADAEAIPVRSVSVDSAVLSGILHHVERPQNVLRETLRTLRPGGRFWGLENNRSIFRPIFDALMRLRKLWNEKAHEENFIMTEAQVGGWIEAAGGAARTWTSTFLPPHIFNLLKPAGAESLLRFTDHLFRTFPWIRRQGGLLLFEGRKND